MDENTNEELYNGPEPVAQQVIDAIKAEISESLKVTLNTENSHLKDQLKQHQAAMQNRSAFFKAGYRIINND